MNKDLSHVYTLPEGTPTILLVKGDVRLEFVVLSEVNIEGPPRSFPALVVRTSLVVPLAYEPTFDEAMNSLRLILSGFPSLGFTAQFGQIGEK